MSDLFYKLVRFIGTSSFWVSSTPVTMGLEHTRRNGAFIVAATHQSAYDVPLIIRHSRRALDFVSVVEVFRKPMVAWFYGSMNAFPLDRSRRDPATIRTILHRLEQGRGVAMFPEGRIAPGENSVLKTRRIRPGVGRIAQLANAPIVPCVILNSHAYERFRSWWPLKETRYGIIFGEPIAPVGDAAQIESELVARLIGLNEILERAMAARAPLI